MRRGVTTGCAGGKGWRGPERIWPGLVPVVGIGLDGGGIGRSGAAGAKGRPATGVAEAVGRGPIGGWIGAPLPSIGGRSGMARGLLSSAAAGVGVAAVSATGSAFTASGDLTASGCFAASGFAAKMSIARGASATTGGTGDLSAAGVSTWCGTSSSSGVHALSCSSSSISAALLDFLT